MGVLGGKGVVGVWEGKNKSIGYPLAFVRSFSSLVGLVGLGIGFRGARWLSCFGRVVINYSVLSWAGGEATRTAAGHEVRGWVYGRSRPSAVGMLRELIAGMGRVTSGDGVAQERVIGGLAV